MTGSAWLKANNVSVAEYNIARSLLMSGPRAKGPTYKAIRKMIGRLRRGDKPGSHGWSSWRSARSV